MCARIAEVRIGDTVRLPAEAAVEELGRIELTRGDEMFHQPLIDGVGANELIVVDVRHDVRERSDIGQVSECPFDEHQAPIARPIERPHQRNGERRIRCGLGEHRKEDWLSIGRGPQRDIEIAQRPSHVASVDGILNQPEPRRQAAAAETVRKRKQTPRSARIAR